MGRKPNAPPLVHGDDGFTDYAEKHLKIIPMGAGITPFRLNAPQRKLDQFIAEIRAEGRPVRIICLKARQEGISTYSLGRMYHFATSGFGLSAFLAAHDEESTRDLFSKVRLMHDECGDRPLTKYSTKTELDFSNPDRKTRDDEPGLQSKIRIGTAGKGTLGRSKTIHYLHLSELAFWPNATVTLLGLEQALPGNPNTVEIIESTANGFGGEFYERWQRASNPDTRGDWRAFFLAWFDLPDYSRTLQGGVMEPVPSTIAIPDKFIEEEIRLQATFSLTQEQINWRRWAIVNRCGGSMDGFRQEFPSTPEEAFLTTGRPVFDRDRLMIRLTALDQYDSQSAGNPVEFPPRFFRGELVQSKGHPKFIPKDGPLWIYKFPEAGREYVIGADPIRGVLIRPERKEGDFAEAHVYDKLTWEQVAVFRDRVEAALFTDVLAMLGYFYGTAYLVPEANDHGHTVCVLLQDKNYPNLHLRQDTDKIGMAPLEAIGFETNRKTKTLWVNAFERYIREALGKLNDKETLRQALSFVRDPKTGKEGGEKGCHDDAVSASALAIVVLDYVPMKAQLSPAPITEETRVASMRSSHIQKHWKAWRERVESGAEVPY